jgi:hypothetical protein
LRQQQITHGCAGVARGVEGRHRGHGRHGHFVLGAGHQAVTPALERLHPLAALAAQAQRQAGGGQAPVGRVGIGRHEADAPRGRGGHGACHGSRLTGRDLELQFGFGHRPMALRNGAA